MNKNKAVSPMEKFLAVEAKINSIFTTLMNTTVSEGDRMTHFVETKPYLEKLKTTLKQVSETGDSVLKGKAEELLVKIEDCLKDFGAKYLGIKGAEESADTGTTTEAVPELITTSKHLNENTLSHQSANHSAYDAKETFFIVVGGSIVGTHSGTTETLLEVLNDKFANQQPIIIKGMELNLKTKTIFAL